MTSLIVGAHGVASALDASTYTSESRLAQGHWVKIKTSKSGMHIITPSTLQRWGFSDPQRVRVYGYGGEQISNVLSATTYVDDLPMAVSEWTAAGLVFYAHGPMVWSLNNSGRWTYTPNYYSTDAYYFVGEATDEELSRQAPHTASPGADGNAATTFAEVAFHEVELVSPGSTGHVLLGEDFSRNRSQTFNFTLTGRADDDLWVQSVFALKAVGGSSTLKMTANGVELSGTSTVSGNSDDSNFHYSLNNVTATGSVAGDKIALGLTFATSANPMRLARLDKITINYSRHLALDGNQLEFRLSGPAAMAGATADTRVWDVTLPTDVRSVDMSVEGGMARWTPTAAGARKYVAWNPSATFATPTAVEVVGNQNLHGVETPDMVIFTLPQYRQQAEALATLHRNDVDDPLDVLVVTQEEAFNEFSSGTPDFGAMRRCLKMFYDRGFTGAGADSKLRYCLMFGRALYDHRGITAESAQSAGNLLFQWQTEGGGDSSQSYTTEDYLAFLTDGSGDRVAFDTHCIGVGRIPVQNTAEAEAAVDKIRSYMADNDKDDWKNRVILATDDGNANVHIDQMEKAYGLMTSTGGGQQYLYHKVYVDAFSLVDGVAVDAHERMMRLLKQGVGWWWYIGHAAVTSWTSDGLLTLSDIVNARYAHQPMLFAATCDFLRWDDHEESGAETLFFNANGIIGAIAASRPVLISLNENMSLAMARSMAANADAGGTLALGDMLRMAKTQISGETNKLRYVLMGDPAMRLSYPRYRAVVDAINDTPPGGEEPPVIMARQNATVEGHLVDAEGNTATDFQGYVIPTLYDAEYSTTSQGHVKEGEGDPEPKVFEEMGDRLYVGRDAVVNGEFKIRMSMPSEITSNYRPATLNLYAVADDNESDAVGVTRDFYVYGYDDQAGDDTTPPVIDMLVLNSEQFRSGDSVDNSPMVMARVSDDTAINISSAGIGHQISLLLDGNRSYPDAYLYYTPGDDGARSGSLYYRLSDLSEGEHSLRLRVWDTTGNMTEDSIDFKVVDGQNPSILALYADCNPAVDHTNFYVRHNRPDAVMRVNVEVYDLMGRLVWTGSQSGTSLLNTSLPLQWNLTDRCGRRVARGIYVYRASVSTNNGQDYVSAARKIAVTAP